MSRNFPSFRAKPEAGLCSPWKSGDCSSFREGGWSHNSEFQAQKRPSFCELTPPQFLHFRLPPRHLWLSRLDAAPKTGAEADAGHVSGALAVTCNVRRAQAAAGTVTCNVGQSPLPL